jgi:hypothetical protein
MNWKDETVFVLSLIACVMVGGVAGFAIGYTHQKPCRPEAISSAQKGNELVCVYEQGRWGVARRVEK